MLKSGESPLNMRTNLSQLMLPHGCMANSLGLVFHHRETRCKSHIYEAVFWIKIRQFFLLCILFSQILGLSFTDSLAHKIVGLTLPGQLKIFLFISMYDETVFKLSFLRGSPHTYQRCHRQSTKLPGLLQSVASKAGGALNFHGRESRDLFKGSKGNALVGVKGVEPPESPGVYPS